MSWVCPVCSTNNIESDNDCMVCGNARVMERTTTKSVASLKDTTVRVEHDTVKIAPTSVRPLSKSGTPISGTTTKSTTSSPSSSMSRSSAVRTGTTRSTSTSRSTVASAHGSSRVTDSAAVRRVKEDEGDAKFYRAGYALLLIVFGTILLPIIRFYVNRVTEGGISWWYSLLGTALILIMFSAMYWSSACAKAKETIKKTWIVPLDLLLIATFIMLVLSLENAKIVNICLDFVVLAGEIFFTVKRMRQGKLKLLALPIALIILDALIIITFI